MQTNQSKLKNSFEKMNLVQKATIQYKTKQNNKPIKLDKNQLHTICFFKLVGFFIKFKNTWPSAVPSQ
jgi:hypothetical protein